MSKNYATTTSCTACPFKKDYSYYVNSKCLDCKFCYRNGNPKRRQASLLLKEAELNSNLFKAPITISKYCDPFYDKWSTENSLKAIEIIQNNGGQIILRTSRNSLLSKIEDTRNIELQCRTITSFENDNIRAILAPGFESPFVDERFSNFSFFFDPLMIGVNDKDLLRLIASKKSKKIIIRQLFATSYFKEYLSTVAGKRWSSILTQNINGYWTYDNTLLLAAVSHIIEYAIQQNVQISFCGNPTLNQIIGLDVNCCLINNPIGIFDGYRKDNPRMPQLKVLQ